MKKIFPILLLALYPALSSGQDNYKVIKVNGTILLKTKGTSLETGTVFAENEDLLFRTDDATAAVINSKKGRLILTSKSHDLSAASSNFLPAMYNIASRGSNILTITDLQKHFSGKYVILGKNKIIPDKQTFPMDKDHFFFLRYAYKGEVINKKLDSSGDSLIIDRDKLYTVDGKPIPSPDNASITLFYRKGGESLKINQFDLIFPDLSQLHKEVQIIIDELKDKSAGQKINEINAYIDENYGKVQRSNLETWLNKNFSLRTK